MFEVIVKKSITTSHAIANERPHEHNWVIEANFRSDTLDKTGCVIDFSVVDATLLEIIKPYENKLINDSAENFARLIFEELAAALNDSAAQLISITAWEDPEHGASYRKV